MSPRPPFPLAIALRMEPYKDVTTVVGDYDLSNHGAVHIELTCRAGLFTDPILEAEGRRWRISNVGGEGTMTEAEANKRYRFSWAIEQLKTVHANTGGSAKMLASQLDADEVGFFWKWH
ncbi:MAG TPA: hypothetical protein VJ746_10095 [Nitrospira sp.]|nr:hypothetical protein [Nitrospira sp.]